MKVTMMLADAAQEVGGKLYILGGGWSVTRPGVPSAVAVYFQVPWDQSDDKHEFLLELLDSDGNPFTDSQGSALQVSGDFQTGRPPGVKPGTPLDSGMAVSIPPLPLTPAARYEWRLTVDGESKSDWRLPFSTAPAEPAPGTTPG